MLCNRSGVMEKYMASQEEHCTKNLKVLLRPLFVVLIYFGSTTQSLS